MPQIFFRLSRKSPGSFARSDGLVVTPSRMPSAAMASMSLMLPVSTNSFIIIAFTFLRLLNQHKGHKGHEEGFPSRIFLCVLGVLCVDSAPQLRLVLDRIREFPDALDFDGHRVTGRQRPDAGRRAGGDDVPGSSVITNVMNSTMYSIEKIRCAV